MSVKWRFDDIDAQGTKKGGDPSGKAFDGNFGTFVREALQNSNDAAKGDSAEVVFDLKQLEGEEIDDFKESFLWNQFIPHLEAVEKSGHLHTVKEFLDRLRDEEKLRLLKVEDRNTEGLGGGEDEDDSNFTGLVKHELFSNKSDEDSAGGNHGVGKSVYWDFSEIATVIFSSNPVNIPGDQEPPRFFGRANLPSHEVEDKLLPNVEERGDIFEFKGTGWIGEEDTIIQNRKEKKRVNSIWGEEARDLSEALHVDHDEDSTGTSITIVGFSEPTSDWRDPAEVKNLIEDSARKYFWPALTEEMGRLDVKIRDEGNSERQITLDAEDDTNPFVKCWEKYLRGDLKDDLETPGDVIKREFELDLPNRDEDGESIETGTATVVVLIRMAKEDVETDYQNEMAMFRSPGMVVHYKNYPKNWVGARPFHAVMVCGEAKKEEDIDEADREFETFLANAEPPEHKSWEVTEDLRNNYKQGFNQLVNRTLPRKARDTVKEAVVREPESGDRGPDKLAGMFQMSRRDGGTTRSGSDFHFRSLAGEMNESQWEVNGWVEPSNEDHSGCEIEIELKIVGEDGSHYESINLEEINSSTAQTEIEEGKAVLKLEEGELGAEFEGKSIELDEDLKDEEIEMKISGEVEE